MQVDHQHGDEAAAADIRTPRSGELALDLARRVGLEHVAFLDVGEVAQHDPAVEAGGDLADVVVEAPQAGDLAVVDRRCRRGPGGPCEPRVILPSVTCEPAIVPTREARKIWRTSAEPSASSTSSGASMPCIASRSSSIAR